MLCLLKYFFDHLRVTSILFDVNMYQIFFISKLVNWAINDPLVHKGLKSQKFSHAIHVLVALIAFSFVKK